MLAPILRLFIAVCLYLFVVACAACAYLFPTWSAAWWPMAFIAGLIGSIIHPDMREVQATIDALNVDNARR